MQRMHNPEREAKKADRISRSKTFKPRITSTDYDSFTFKCRLCMMGFRRRGMLVSAKRLPDPPVSVCGDGFCAVFCTRFVTRFCRWLGEKPEACNAQFGVLSFPGSLCPPLPQLISGDLLGEVFFYHVSLLVFFCCALPNLCSSILFPSSLLCSWTYFLVRSFLLSSCSPFQIWNNNRRKLPLKAGCVNPG